jgi:hypothetical protein
MQQWNRTSVFSAHLQSVRAFAVGISKSINPWMWMNVVAAVL